MNIAFLQSGPDTSCQHEMSLLRSGLTRRGWQIYGFDYQSMVSGKVKLPANALVAGEVDAVVAAMIQLKIPVPQPVDYPDVLRPYLHRKIWRGKLGDLRRRFESGHGQAIFAKPAANRKRFRGRVFRSVEDLVGLASLSESTAILFSEVIPFISEFRFYIVQSKIVCHENYDGDPRDRVDESVVRAAIDRLGRASQAPAAFAIDFGLLQTGETALVEMNDGFSVGTYREISAEDYTEFTLTRWIELLGPHCSQAGTAGTHRRI